MRLSHHVTAEIEECAHPGFGEGRVVVPELILPGTSFALGRSQHIQICLISFRCPRHEEQTRSNLWSPGAQTFSYLSAKYSFLSGRAYISRSTTIVNRCLSHVI